MRSVAIVGALLGAMLAGGLIPLAAGEARAGPPVAAAPPNSHNFVEKAGWRRYCRRYGCGPDGVYPGAPIIPDAETEIGAEIELEPDPPAVIVLPPPRPSSCGQYRYWDGSTCVDARYTDPYLGPR